jgi:hypothetical protein
MDKLWNRLMQRWWGHWCVAAFFFTVALTTLWLFSNLEARGRVEARGIVTLLYKWFGKSFLPILFGVAGVVFTLTGFWKWIVQRGPSNKQDQKDLT